MIPRYEKKEIAQIWSDNNKFNYYLHIELALLEALEKNDIIPKGIKSKIENKSIINPTRINEIEEITKHDIIAFCTSITENIDAQIGKYFHFGVTSSDIIDSAQTLQIRDSLKIIIQEYKTLLKTFKMLIDSHSDIITLGRSHGMFAEPISFSQKWLSFYCEFYRRYKELVTFYENDLTVQLSGAVGNYTVLTPDIEKDAANILGLKVETVSTQVIPRDRIAKLISIGALIGSAIERTSVELRHLHRSDVAELHEGFKKGQKGSSTMPHKKNPISSENLTGMARILRSHVSMAMDNIILWHERDISHSCAERMYLPDHFGVLYYSITRLNDTLKNLVLHKEKIEDKVKNNFTYLSSYFLHQLIKNTDLKRDELYELVQSAAFFAQEKNSMKVFGEKLSDLLKEKDINFTIHTLNLDEIRSIYLKHFNATKERTFNEYPLP